MRKAKTERGHIREVLEGVVQENDGVALLPVPVRVSADEEENVSWVSRTAGFA